MTSDEMQDIARFFDDLATREILVEFDEEEKKKVAALLNRWDIQPGDRILEPGCGAGRLTALLADRVGPEGAVLAMDVSPGMIQKAQARNLPAQVELLCGSVYKTPRPDNSFDKILCFCVFPHLTRHTEALAEFARLLRPGGQIWINHLVSRTAINDHHRKVETVVSDHRLPDRNAIIKMLKKQGFGDIHLEDAPKGYALVATLQG